MQPPTFCEKSISSDHSPPDRATPCRPPENRPVPQESLQKTRYATSRNPRNGAAILAVPRLNLLARPEAATKANDSVAARDQHSAFSRQLLNQSAARKRQRRTDRAGSIIRMKRRIGPVCRI